MVDEIMSNTFFVIFNKRSNEMLIFKIGWKLRKLFI